MGCCRGGAGLGFCGGASGAKGCYANERESGLIAEEQWVADMPGLVYLWGSQRVSNEPGTGADTELSLGGSNFRRAKRAENI